MDSDLLALHWMEHASVFSQAIGNLRTKTTYTDATLACEGHFFPVHKFVLSTCSQYFNAIFEWTPCINPVVVINNVTCKELEALLDFMYIGEVSVKESLIPDVMRAAECLRIRGLSIVDDESAKSQLKKKNKSDSGGPPRKRKRAYVPKKKVSTTASDTPTSHQPSESSSHLSPSPSSASGHHCNNEGNMNNTEDHAPELSSPQYSERHPSESQNHDFDLLQTPVQSNAPSHILPTHKSSSLTVQPLQALPPPSNSIISQYSQISPSHHTTQSHPSALDLSSHEQKPEVNMNSRKMELGESKPNTTQAHSAVSSEEIPDLLDSLVDMRPLYDTKPEPGDEVATFHAVEPSEKLYEFTEELPSASSTPSHQEVRYQKGPATSGSSKKSDQNSTEVNPALKCSFCGKQCMKKDSLTRHMRTHTKEPYTCKQCPFTSKTYKAFIEHKKDEHASLHRCTICEFTTTRYDTLKRHMVGHGKPHKCPECKYSTSSLQNLQKHTKNKHEKK